MSKKMMSCSQLAMVSKALTFQQADGGADTGDQQGQEDREQQNRQEHFPCPGVHSQGGENRPHSGEANCTQEQDQDQGQGDEWYVKEHDDQR